MATNATGNEQAGTESLMTLVRRVRSFCEAKEGEIREQAGLSEAQYAVLSAMPAGEAVVTGELCRRVGVSPSRGGRVIDELVRLGFLQRAAGAGDRRVLLLTLSARGRVVRRRIERLVCRCDDVLRGKLSAADHALVVGGLRTLLATIEVG
ncbi:MAG: MarR family transcriptional regulator [Deltaproteobacteria bacterium]|nr:MarR family transcriptional regulator [Deltaproteobacteria bacterium]